MHYTLIQSYKIPLFLSTGVILGGDEFLQGLGIGLKSFLGGTAPIYPLLTCTLGGIAGAGAKVTGAVGDVFAKLTFDEEFIDRRQQQKAAPPRFGSKFTGFAKVRLRSKLVIH